MSQNVRQACGLALLFASMGLAYVWLGVPGIAGMWLGLATMWAIVGLAVDYWMGADPVAERMIPEMMRRLRERVASDRLSGES